MNNYIIKKDFVDLKKIYEENNIELFEKRISTYSPKELFEFVAYFSLNISSKDEYYNVKILSEIAYNILSKIEIEKADKFVILSLKHLGRCVYLSKEKGNWNDVIKYGLLILEYTLDNDEEKTIQDYLSYAYFCKGDYEKELLFRKKLLEEDYLSLYNYALALFHNQKYEESRFYYNRCLEKKLFPPALRNQAHVCVVLDNDYDKAYEFCEKAMEAYYKDKESFPEINPIGYLLHQFIISGLCSSEYLYAELSQHKLKFLEAMEKNSELSQNIHIVHFIECCSYSNRAIYYFERMDFDKCWDFFQQSLKIIDTEKKIIDEELVIISFYNKIEETIRVYILLIQVLLSFKSLFFEEHLDSRYDLKINKLEEIIDNINDDFVYEYKQVIRLFSNYLVSVITFILEQKDKDIDNLNKIIANIKIKRCNCIMNEVLHSLYEMEKIFCEYKKNLKISIFQEDLKKEYLRKIQIICNNFCLSFRKLTNSALITEENSVSGDKEFCKEIVKAIFQMKKHIPKFIKNFLSNNQEKLQEEDFRDTLGYFFSAKYDITAEEVRKEGKVDLVVDTGYEEQSIIEFKVWGRNDYKDVVQQIVDRYLTEFDAVGYIFMINPNKTPIVDKYIENIIRDETGYISESLKNYTINNFTFWESRHRTKFCEYKIYHFIYNVYE